MDLRLGRHTFGPDRTLMMAIVNRTPDSFYDGGRMGLEESVEQRVWLIGSPEEEAIVWAFTIPSILVLIGTLAIIAGFGLAALSGRHVSGERTA